MSAVSGRPYLTSSLLERAGLPHLFSTRYFPGVASTADGGAPFTPAALPLLAGCGLAAAPAYTRQIHGSQVLVAESEGRLGEADALLTERADLPLAIFTADCLPLLMYDPSGRRLAAVHAGWRGTVQSVARAAVDRLVEAGSAPDGLIVAIGPSIGPCCYEVGEEVASPFRDRFGDAIVTDRKLDLWTAAEQLGMPLCLHTHSNFDGPDGVPVGQSTPSRRTNVDCAEGGQH